MKIPVIFIRLRTVRIRFQTEIRATGGGGGGRAVLSRQTVIRRSRRRRVWVNKGIERGVVVRGMVGK